MKVELTAQKLTQLIKAAEAAHAKHEKNLGKRDENWPRWYAEYILEKLQNN